MNLLRIAILFALCLPVAADTLSGARDEFVHGNYEVALRHYAAALEAEPNLRAAESGIESVLKQGLPLWIDEPYVALLPVDRVDVVARRVCILTPKPHVTLATPPYDTKTAASYPREAGAYELRDGKYYLVAIARRPEGFPPGVAADALRVFAVCRLAAEDMKLRKVYREASLADPRYRQVNTIWLQTTGTPGGEAIGRSVWLSGLTAETPPEDVVRIVSHEAGHVLVPQIAGFEAPEPGAEGYLGEILFPYHALRAGIPLLGRPDADAILKTAIEGKAERLQSTYAQHAGETDPGGGIDGMRILIGGVLSIEKAGKSSSIGSMLGERAIGRAKAWKAIGEGTGVGNRESGVGEERP